MKVLLYKRTHTGDPNSAGIFGCYNCMGRVRSWKYDAVIGLGSLTPWKNSIGIAGKVTWIGVHPTRFMGPYKDPQVQFERFILLNEKGPLFSVVAPTLAKRIRMVRAMMTYSEAEYKEILDIINIYCP